MKKPDLSSIRKEYLEKKLDESDIPNDPFVLFTNWFYEVLNGGVNEPSAMFLATASKEGTPSGRIVLLKGFDHKGFVFYTNYFSSKGVEMEENPVVAATFFWKEVERQVRITGTVIKTSIRESDEYFRSRPFDSRISATISPQSGVIQNRQFLEERRNKLIESVDPENLQRPENWGGYRIKPTTFEFWQGREYRLHDRIRYRKVKNHWVLERLAP
ncbi:MAG: pyridoxamine 5'-phosphate oxidase [Bacteroidota bacterium]